MFLTPLLCVLWTHLLVCRICKSVSSWSFERSAYSSLCCFLWTPVPNCSLYFAVHAYICECLKLLNSSSVPVFLDAGAYKKEKETKVYWYKVAIVLCCQVLSAWCSLYSFGNKYYYFGFTEEETELPELVFVIRDRRGQAWCLEAVRAKAHAQGCGGVWEAGPSAAGSLVLLDWRAGR